MANEQALADHMRTTDPQPSCGDCAHGANYAPPDGPEPVFEKPPKEVFGVGPFGFGPSVGLILFEISAHRALAWRAATAKSQTKVECRRFPTFVERAKDDACGEFALREGV